MCFMFGACPDKERVVQLFFSSNKELFNSEMTLAQCTIELQSAAVSTQQTPIVVISQVQKNYLYFFNFFSSLSLATIKLIAVPPPGAKFSFKFVLLSTIKLSITYTIGFFCQSAFAAS